MKSVIYIISIFVIFTVDFSNSQSPCDCPNEDGWICGTDGNWYTDCMLMCVQNENPENAVTATSEDQCKPKNESTVGGQGVSEKNDGINIKEVRLTDEETSAIINDSELEKDSGKVAKTEDEMQGNNKNVTAAGGEKGEIKGRAVDISESKQSRPPESTSELKKFGGTKKPKGANKGSQSGGSKSGNKGGGWFGSNSGDGNDNKNNFFFGLKSPPTQKPKLGSGWKKGFKPLD